MRLRSNNARSQACKKMLTNGKGCGPGRELKGPTVPHKRCHSSVALSEDVANSGKDIYALITPSVEEFYASIERAWAPLKHMANVVH
jgi:hypothetical protein